jgi:hypothetical protein
MERPDSWGGAGQGKPGLSQAQKSEEERAISGGPWSAGLRKVQRSWLFDALDGLGERFPWSRRSLRIQKETLHYMEQDVGQGLRQEQSEESETASLLCFWDVFRYGRMFMEKFQKRSQYRNLWLTNKQVIYANPKCMEHTRLGEEEGR